MEQLFRRPLTLICLAFMVLSCMNVYDEMPELREPSSKYYARQYLKGRIGWGKMSEIMCQDAQTAIDRGIFMGYYDYDSFIYNKEGSVMTVLSGRAFAQSWLCTLPKERDPGNYGFGISMLIIPHLDIPEEGRRKPSFNLRHLTFADENPKTYKRNVIKRNGWWPIFIYDDRYARIEIDKTVLPDTIRFEVFDNYKKIPIDTVEFVLNKEATAKAARKRPYTLKNLRIITAEPVDDSTYYFKGRRNGVTWHILSKKTPMDTCTVNPGRHSKIYSRVIPWGEGPGLFWQIPPIRFGPRSELLLSLYPVEPGRYPASTIEALNKMHPSTRSAALYEAEELNGPLYDTNAWQAMWTMLQYDIGIYEELYLKGNILPPQSLKY